MPTPPTCDEANLPEVEPLSVDRIAAIAKALGHPARVRIICQFEDGVSFIAQDIASECTLAQSTVSEHLRILREAGVLCARKDGPRVWYCLRPLALRQFSSAVAALAEQSLVAV